MGPPQATFLPPEIEELLFDLGLTASEVRIYQFLHKSAAAVPSLIASSTGESRGRIYQTMRRLVDKGFVREVATRPIQYAPVPLPEILSIAQKRLGDHLRTVQEKALLIQVGDSGTRIPMGHPAHARDVVVFSGRKACHAEVRRMLVRAEHFFWLMGGDGLRRRMEGMPELIRELKEAGSRGVDVKVFVPPHPANKVLRTSLASDDGAVVHEITAPDGPITTCVTEQGSMEIVVQPDDDSPNIGTDVAIQTRSTALVEAAQRRVTADSGARTARSDAALFQWLGPNHGTDLFLEAIKTARSAVDVIGPRDWAQYLTRSWDEMIPIYAGAKARGVKFRALIVNGTETSGAKDALAAIWDIRVVSWIPVWLTVVDGQSLYQAFPPPAPTSPPQFRQSAEPNEVRFYQEVFDQLWKTGRPLIAP